MATFSFRLAGFHDAKKSFAAGDARGVTEAIVAAATDPAGDSYTGRVALWLEADGEWKLITSLRGRDEPAAIESQVSRNWPKVVRLAAGAAM